MVETLAAWLNESSLPIIRKNLFDRQLEQARHFESKRETRIIALRLDGIHRLARYAQLVWGDRLIGLAGPVQRELIRSVLFLRALLSFLVLPGTFAGLLPAWIVASDGAGGEAWIAGAVPLVFGMMMLLWCVRDFYVAGKGTLAPWDPPRHLVIVGLYHFTRNPMYVGVLLLLIGWSLLAGSPRLVGYTVILAIAFHLRVVLCEEPTLAKTFGKEWTHYSATVPRWLRPLPRPAP